MNRLIWTPKVRKEPATIAIGAMALTAASTAYQVKTSEDAKDEAKNAANAQQKQYQDALKQQQQADADAQQMAQNTVAQKDALSRQKQARQSAMGRAGTILTRPGSQGLVAKSNTIGSSSLLGS